MNLTTEQKRAMEFIEKYGSIVRYEGGFWSKPDAELDGVLKAGLSGINPNEFRYPKNYVGTNTINALIRKGVIKVTKELTSKAGHVFPVECSAIEKTNLTT